MSKLVKHPNPVGLDLAIEKLQTALSTITWLDVVFARAYEDTEYVNGNKKVKASVYKGKGDYRDVLPDDRIKNYCFFELENDLNVIGEGLSHKELEGDICIVFWFNMKNMGGSYIILEQLKQDIIKALRFNTEFQIETITDKREEIFRKYTIDEGISQFLTYPHGGIKLCGKINFKEQCI